jgi:predicted nuclease of predicted toxin-antitoxin system
MSFKLDENFSPRLADVIRKRGVEATIVREQGLQGISDQRLDEVCCSESKRLGTLDLDFANVIRFPPGRSAGIVVLRPPARVNPTILEAFIVGFLDALPRIPVEKCLCIAEQGRIRIHQGDETDDNEE